MDSFDTDLDEGNNESRRRLRGDTPRDPAERGAAQERAERGLYEEPNPELDAEETERGARTSRGARGSHHSHDPEAGPLDDDRRRSEQPASERPPEKNRLSGPLSDEETKRDPAYGIDSPEDLGRQTQDTSRTASTPRPGKMAPRVSNVEEEINNALMQHPELDAARIDVKVSKRGEVTLSGEVASEANVRLAEQLAMSSAGATRVVNNLSVAGSRRTAGEPARADSATRSDVEGHAEIDRGPSGHYSPSER